MPHRRERLRPTLAADSDALTYAALLGRTGETLLAEADVEPIAVPRPLPFDTITIGVVTGRPLELEFMLAEVTTNAVEQDDLILGFASSGKVVLKQYMHAFGLLGDQRAVIIQPDGQLYAFADLHMRPVDIPANAAGRDEPIAAFDPLLSLGPLDHLSARGGAPIDPVPPEPPPPAARESSEAPAKLDDAAGTL